MVPAKYECRYRNQRNGRDDRDDVLHGIVLILRGFGLVHQFADPVDVEQNRIIRIVAEAVDEDVVRFRSRFDGLPIGIYRGACRGKMVRGIMLRRMGYDYLKNLYMTTRFSEI